MTRDDQCHPVTASTHRTKLSVNTVDVIFRKPVYDVSFQREEDMM